VEKSNKVNPMSIRHVDAVLAKFGFVNEPSPRQYHSALFRIRDFNQEVALAPLYK
jgi:hypothetical protein